MLDVVRGCHVHTRAVRALRYIRPLLTLDAAKTFAVAIVSSRLDYCNRVQRVQDVLARVVAQAPWSVSSTHLRCDFHWLPIRQRIVYKQCLMTYKAVYIGQPNYLNELIQPYQPVRTLRSPTSALLVIPFVRSDFASDAFPFLPLPSGTISLRMFEVFFHRDHALTRPLSNRD